VPPAVSDDALDILERIVVGSVAVTAKALGETEADLTLVQWRVLLVVGEDGAGATVSEVAARLGAHASPASRLVSRLAHRGLVNVVREPSDGRVRRVRLTAAGRSLRLRVLAQRRRDLAAILTTAALAPTERPAIAKLAGAFQALS